MMYLYKLYNVLPVNVLSMGHTPCTAHAGHLLSMGHTSCTAHGVHLPSLH